MESKQHSPALADPATSSIPANANANTESTPTPVTTPTTTAAEAATVAATTTARSVGFTLSSLGYAVARRFRTTLEPSGLEPREFALLRAVAPIEGASQQAIGERLRIPASRMVAFVDALEERGLLERRHKPDDRRVRALYLTDDGREVLASAFTLASELERHLCTRLNDAEREQLLDVLQKVGAQLGLAPGTHAAHLDETH
jgi:DNA-binding MarR family transcriptional regulator